MFLSEISYHDIISYFLNIFFDSFILVLAFVFLTCCMIGSMVYLLFQKKDDHYGSSFLNVLNGDLMMLLSFQSIFDFLELIWMKVLEDDSCTILIGKRILNLITTQIYLLLTIATILNHFRYQ